MRGMSCLCALLSIPCGVFAGAQPEYTSHEGVWVPPPFRAATQVISSSPQEVVLQVSIQVTDPAALPSQEPVPLGFVAIAPTGNVEASILEAEASPLGDLSRVNPVPVGELPASVVSVGTPGIWRDLRIVDVYVRPCWGDGDRYSVAQRLLLTITHVGGKGVNEKTRPVRAVSPLWDALYRRHVLNYEWLNLPRLERGTGKRYIVVSRSVFNTQTPQFQEWKTRQGYGAEVITLESLGYTDPTTNAAMDATKNYILNAYNTWPDGLDFVLLVGDIYSSNLAGSIYTKKFYNEFYYQGYRYHDQWYAYLEGDDVFADILVGRFPDTNASRMGYQLSKSISYEMNPYLSGTWQNNALMTLKANHPTQSVNDHIIAAKNTVSSTLSSWGMNVIQRFQNQATPSQILPVVNQGVTFYNCRVSSCSSTDWNGTFTSNDVAYVNNTNKLGLWTVLSCSSAEFDQSTTSTAELLLRRDSNDPSNPKGAVAFIGSQAYTSYLFNDPLDEGIYYAWADSNVTMVGQALLSGKMYAWVHATGLTPGERNSGMHEYTTLGDPSLQLYTRVPAAATVVVAPSQVPVGVSTQVVVSVSTALGPVRNALVCLRKAGEVYVWGYTNEAGSVSLPVSPTSTGTMDLTVTAYNVQPYLGNLPVTAAVPPASPTGVVATPTPLGGLQLTWSPVTQDVLGNPVSIHHYEVYRQTVAYFSIMGLSPIGTTTGTSYVDPQAVGDPSTNRFYRIVAVSLTQGSSAPSSPVGEFDYSLGQ